VSEHTDAPAQVDTASVTVAAAPGDIWDMVSDVTRMGEWSPARSWLVRLAGPLVGGADSHAGELREGMRQTLARLKAAAESPTP